jgi:dTDP-4-dehydrorhamnose 3,5-epimerase
MPRHYQEVEVLLKKLATCMLQTRLWSQYRPSEKALASQQPFALDTMSFENWLQFIFLPNMNRIVTSREPLPEKLVLLPIAEKCYGYSAEYAELIGVIARIDELFNE